ncbi:NfeD family protein [Pseudohongiella spirulinae]|uniref:Putative membrane-bound ClpP-class protease n=1 Tax=Pseudohongiella spirulinae TaxID=1249552 RepID=A0A0S2KBN4_9GAMM|nr:nodulation protein NfeD [Pseudohongiella spirulinae]ALO45346.1 Putative membrane-bound ClpP-class protease [Pseudohongiella spirulinae]
MNRLHRPVRLVCLTLLVALSCLSFAPQVYSQPPASDSESIALTDLTGPIGPASADHIIRALERAENMQLLIIRMDTPGGLDAAMRDIVSAILASPVPVVVWVAPSGARAASAGTYILTASHIAAMAPATNVGSSTPVALGSGETNEKVLNDAVAYLQGLAELRGRNQDWARDTVINAANLSANDALDANVIDIVASNISELLTALHGRTVVLDDNSSRTLDTANASVTMIESDWRHDFLSIITNPNIAYLLLMVGVYGLILEFYNPGMGIPGIVGVISLLVGAYALQMLPISYVGLSLIVLGLGLMVFEVTTPSFGIFGLGGLVAFILGSVMLMDTNEPAWQISFALIAAIAVSTAALVLLVLGAALKARQARITTGVEAMPGQLAIAREDFTGEGHVHMHGEIWRATTPAQVKKGDRLRVSRVDGLTLHVTPDNNE